MRFEITGRQVTVTPAMQRVFERLLAKIDKRLNDSALSAEAVLSRAKLNNKTEITLHARGEKFLRGVGEAATWDASIRAAFAKIEQQAEKMKSKWQEGKRQRLSTSRLAAEAAAMAEAAEAPKAKARKASREGGRMPAVLAATRQAVKTLSVSEATRKLGSGDGVMVFRDATSGKVGVLVRRGGELTLVETDA